MAFTVIAPIMQERRRAAAARAVAVDLRGFADAFQKYAHDHGDWPAGTFNPDELPAGMAPLLANTRWAQPTPLGGRYVWLTDTMQRGDRVHALIAIVTVGDHRLSTDSALLRAADAAVDDGDLAGGRFRLGFRNEPIYVLE